MSEAALDLRDQKKYTSYLNGELEAVAIYSGLALKENDQRRADILTSLASSEMRHARHWASKLGIPEDNLQPKMTFRARMSIMLARRMGTQASLSLILRREFKDIRIYNNEPDSKGILEDERRHAQTLSELIADGVAVDILQSEGRQRVGAASNIRAAVLGFNDGLVAVFALMTGVAGGTSDQHIIVLAGIAGLLAGAFSMGAGEWLSVRAQVDVYEREVEIEREELKESPEKELEELVLIYQSKGLTRLEAEVVARRIISNPKKALDTMAKEELGLDPSQMGSPWGVAISSVTAFTLGALFPLAPYFFTHGVYALGISIIASAVALVVAGAFLSYFSNKNPAWGAIRMLLIGSASAAVTFTIGRILGVHIA